MLVCVWDAMDVAINQIMAEEWLAQYTVAVVSSPYADKDSRENILDGWRKMIAGTWKTITRSSTPESDKSSGGGDMPLRQVIQMVRDAFGRSIRD